MRDTQKLTVRQQAFVAEYLVDLNATQAAIRAGYSSKGADVTASKLLVVPKVARAVAEAFAARAKRTEIEADTVLRELARIAFSDIRDVVSWDADGLELKASDTLTVDAAATVKEIRSSKTTTTEDRGRREVERVEHVVKLYDKQRALVDLGRHLGLFPSRVELSGPGGGPIPVLVALFDGMPSEEIRGYMAALRQQQQITEGASDV